MRLPIVANLIILLLGMAAGAASAAAPAVRTAAFDTNIAWSSRRNQPPVRYRVGDVMLTLRAAGSADWPNRRRPSAPVPVRRRAPPFPSQG